MKRILFCLIAISLFALPGCGVDMEPKIANQSNVLVDNWVKRVTPMVSLQPKNNPPQPMRAIITPFKLTQNLPQSRDIGTNITKIFWQAWNSMNVFPAFYFEPGLDYNNTEQSLLVARDRGADLIVTGTITYLLTGGSAGSNAVSLNVEIIDVATRQPIWSISQTGSLDPGLETDFILFRKRDRMPMDPINSIVTALAVDTGSLVQQWNNSGSQKPRNTLSPPSSQSQGGSPHGVAAPQSQSLSK